MRDRKNLTLPDNDILTELTSTDQPTTTIPCHHHDDDLGGLVLSFHHDVEGDILIDAHVRSPLSRKVLVCSPPKATHSLVRRLMSTEERCQLGGVGSLYP